MKYGHGLPPSNKFQAGIAIKNGKNYRSLTMNSGKSHIL
jgi:hypothetical protein